MNPCVAYPARRPSQASVHVWNGLLTGSLCVAASLCHPSLALATEREATYHLECDITLQPRQETTEQGINRKYFLDTIQARAMASPSINGEEISLAGSQADGNRDYHDLTEGKTLSKTLLSINENRLRDYSTIKLTLIQYEIVGDEKKNAESVSKQVDLRDSGELTFFVEDRYRGNVAKVRLRLVLEAPVRYPQGLIEQLTALEVPRQKVVFMAPPHLAASFRARGGLPKGEANRCFAEDVIGFAGQPLAIGSYKTPVGVGELIERADTVKPYPVFKGQTADITYRDGHSYRILTSRGREVGVSKDRPLFQWTVDACRQLHNDADGPVALLVEHDESDQGRIVGLYDLSSAEGVHGNLKPPAIELISVSEEWFDARDLIENRDLKPALTVREPWRGKPLRIDVKLAKDERGRPFVFMPRGNFPLPLNAGFDKEPAPTGIGGLVDLAFDAEGDRVKAKLATPQLDVSVVRDRREGRVVIAPDDVRVFDESNNALRTLSDKATVAMVVKMLVRGQRPRIVSTFHEQVAAAANVGRDGIVLDISAAQPLRASIRYVAPRGKPRPASGWVVEFEGGVKETLDREGTIAVTTLEEYAGQSRRIKLVPSAADSSFDRVTVTLPAVDPFKGTSVPPIEQEVGYARVVFDPSRIDRLCPAIVLSTATAPQRRVLLRSSMSSWPGGRDQARWFEESAKGGWNAAVPKDNGSYELGDLVAVEPVGLHSQRITYVSSNNNGELAAAAASGSPEDWERFFDDAAGIDVHLGDDPDDPQLAVKIGDELPRPLERSVLWPNTVGRPFGPAEIEEIRQGKGVLLQHGREIRKLQVSQFLDHESLKRSPAVEQPLVVHFVIVNGTGRLGDLSDFWQELQVPLARSLAKPTKPFTFNAYVVSIFQGEARETRVVSDLPIPLGAEAKGIYPGLTRPVPMATVGAGQIDNAVPKVIDILSKNPKAVTGDDRVVVMAVDPKGLGEGAAVDGPGWSIVALDRVGAVALIERAVRVDRFHRVKVINEENLRQVLTDAIGPR